MNEDNILNQKLIKVYLKKIGYQEEVEMCNNGVEGVQWVLNNCVKLKEQSINLIIFMDVSMPEMVRKSFSKDKKVIYLLPRIQNGIEATTRIRAIEKEKNANRSMIIGLTASAENRTRVACEAAGMDYFVLKPVKLFDLKNLVARVVSSFQ